jgi:tetracycline resistance efflux pump
MISLWLALTPPLIVLLSTIVTQHLRISLLLGILTAALVSSSFYCQQSLALVIIRMKEQLFNIDSILIYLFLCAVGTIVALLEYTKLTAAFTSYLTHKVRTPVTAQLASIGLSGILAIDDYLNSLTTGYVMRPLFDSFKIPRVKLAFLVHALSGPLVILIPVSSWVAYILSQMSMTGIGGASIALSPVYVYSLTVPCILYSHAMIIGTLYLVLTRTSYGPMATYEKSVISHPEPSYASSRAPHTAYNFLLPLGTLVIVAIIGIMILRHTTLSPFWALCTAGMVGLLVGIIRCLSSKQITFNKIPHLVCSGIELMSPAIQMVFLASTLGTMLRTDLMVGQHIAHLITDQIALPFLPLVLYLISLCISTITGSSWGTIALMLPIGIPLLTEIAGTTHINTIADLPYLLPALGAILSGAVCGDQISPLSETTIMASTSAGCSPVAHVYTQIFYAAPAIIGAFAGFLWIALIMPSGFIWITLGGATLISMLIAIIIMYVAQKLKGIA